MEAYIILPAASPISLLAWMPRMSLCGEALRKPCGGAWEEEPQSQKSVLLGQGWVLLEGWPLQDAPMQLADLACVCLL